MKRFARSWLRNLGSDVVRYVPELSRPFDVLTLVVESRLRSTDSFYFVQVGANDGALDDPIRHLVQGHGLAGLLIEPLPDLYSRLVQTYEGQDKLSFENVAVGRRPGVAQIYRVRSDAQVPEHWHGMASFSRAHLIKEGAPTDLVEACNVDVVPIERLFAKHAIRHIDLLQIDVEGFDYEVLESVFATGMTPAIINYEHCHLVPKIRNAAKQMLLDRGYRFIEVGKDTLAVLD